MNTITEALKSLKEEKLAVLDEGKADDIYDKYYSDIDRDIFDKIWKADPTSTEDVRGKFVPWLLAQYKKGANVVGQLSRITKCLKAYGADKNKFNTALKTSDINTLDLDTFLNVVENTDKTAFRQKLEATGEVVTIASSKNYDVFHPLSWAGNAYIIGKSAPGARGEPHDLNWCTGYYGDESYFNRYGGDYYCFIWKEDRTNKNKCFQINIRSDRGDLEYFLDGKDENPINGGDTASERFVIFLLSEPDLLEELVNSVLYKKCASLRTAYEVLQTAKEGKPLAYKGEFVLPSSFKYIRSVLHKVEVEDGVKKIRPGVFANCVSLEEVVFAPSVEVVEARAFSGCNSLSNLQLNEGLKDIRSLAFLENVSLKRVDIPDSLERFDISSFKDCSNVVLRVNNIGGKRYLEVTGDLTEDDYRWLRKHVKQIRQ